MTIEQYIKAVDKAVSNIAGISVHDLPDYDFASAHQEGTTPSETAKQMLEDEGFYE